MSTTETKEGSTGGAGDVGEVMLVGNRREWHRRARGLVTGVVLALLVYLFFPSNAVEVVAGSAGFDPEADYSRDAMRITAATTVLMGAWWLTAALPLPEPPH